MQLPLNFTVLLAEDLTWSNSACQPVFPRLTGDARAAIIGMVAAPHAAPLSVSLGELAIQDRHHIHGEPVLLSALARGERMAVDDETTPLRMIAQPCPYFPGSAQALPLGERGERVAAIPLKGGQEIRMRLSDLSGGAAELTALGLLLAEWPVDSMGFSEAEWNGLEAAWAALSRGIGVLNAYGASVVYDGALSGVRRASKLKGSYPQRRIQLAAGQLDDDGLNDEEGLDRISYMLRTDREVAQSNLPVPHRLLFGQSGFPGHGVTVDMPAEMESYVDIYAAAPDAERSLHLCTITEGLADIRPFIPRHRGSTGF